MRVKFKHQFYHPELGLIPRKLNMLNTVIEVADNLAGELPTADLEVVEADPKVMKVYEKRLKDRRSFLIKAKGDAKLFEARKQTELMTTLMKSMQEMAIVMSQNQASQTGKVAA